MAALTEHSPPSRILMIGDNGSGKTGALVSLAKAGYKVFVADADNGAEILYHLTADDLAARARIDVETHTDLYAEVAGAAMVKPPLKCFAGIAKVLTDWPGHGKPSTWGPDHVLVLDSLTFTGRGILNHVMLLNGRLNGKVEIQHWGMAMELQENLIAMLTGASMKCHIIVMAHVTYVQPEGEMVSKGYPSALGNKLPPRIGGYFNTMLNVRPQGSGPNMKRMIYTKPVGQVDCKTPAPGLVKDAYPLETGLAEFFEALHGKPPKA